MKHITIQGLRLEYRDYPATAAILTIVAAPWLCLP